MFTNYKKIIMVGWMGLMMFAFIHPPAVYSDRVKGKSVHYLPFIGRSIPAQLNPPLADYLALVVSNVDGDQEIYTVRGDGSELHQLTVNNVLDINARLSPDGNLIAFVQSQSGSPLVRRAMVMNRDGSDLRPLGQALTGQQVNVTWSPDSQHLFVHLWNAPYLQIMLVEVDGTTTEIFRYVPPYLSNLTANTEWSPNGRYFYHLQPSDDLTSATLWMVEVATGTSSLLRSLPLGAQAIQWHPDSRELLVEERTDDFYSPRGWLLPPDGSGERLLYEDGLQFVDWLGYGQFALLQRRSDHYQYYNLSLIPRIGGEVTALTSEADGVGFTVEKSGRGVGFLYWSHPQEDHVEPKDFYWYSLESNEPRLLITVTLPSIPLSNAIASQASVAQDGSGLFFTLIHRVERGSRSEVYYVDLTQSGSPTLFTSQQDVWVAEFLPHSSLRGVAYMTYFYEAFYPKTKIPRMMEIEPQRVFPLPFTSTFFDVTEWRYLPW